MNNSLKKFMELNFNRCGKALDLGAGDFFDVACLERLGWKCEGVDINTGINLEFAYLSKDKPFDLVFSNYLLHKLKNKRRLIQTAFDNLKKDGWFFLHTFDQSDLNAKSDITVDSIKRLLEELGFKNIVTKVFDYYDNDEGHKHWHKILEATAQK